MNSEKIMMIDQCMSAGVSLSDTLKLIRISNTLHRWYELECGVDGGCIERDEDDGLPYWVSASTGKRTYRLSDRENGALKRLEKIMAAYQDMSYRVQGDPRGPALYLHHDGNEFAVY